MSKASRDLERLFSSMETLRKYQREAGFAYMNHRLPSAKCVRQVRRIQAIAARIDVDALDPNKENFA